MTEYEITFMECERHDQGIIEADLVKINVKNIRCKGYSDQREEFVFTCAVPSNQTDKFEDILDENFVCKYRQV